MGSNVSIAAKNETIFDVINSVERGELTADLDNAVRDVVSACQDTGKGGSITLTLTVRPDSRLGAIRIGGQVKAKTPVKVTKEALFFPTPEGNLSRYDSKQHDMFIEQQAAKKSSTHDPETGEVHG